MNAQRLTIITAIILALAGAGFYFYNQNQTPLNPAATFDGTLDLSEQPFIGAEDAPITVVAFEDFKCPHCATFEETVFPKLERDFIRDGKVKFYFVNFTIPLGQGSITAALASECVFEQNPEAVWEYNTFVFRSQQPGTQEWATPSFLTELADTYLPDIDTGALRSCIDDERYLERVQNERAMGAAAGVQGTPTVFVNDQIVTNGANYDALKAVIEGALEN